MNKQIITSKVGISNVCEFQDNISVWRRRQLMGIVSNAKLEIKWQEQAHIKSNFKFSV